MNTPASRKNIPKASLMRRGRSDGAGATAATCAGAVFLFFFVVAIVGKKAWAKVQY